MTLPEQVECFERSLIEQQLGSERVNKRHDGGLGFAAQNAVRQNEKVWPGSQQLQIDQS